MEQSIYFYPDGRLDAKNASLYLGLRPKTLSTWRWNGKGPKFIKRGRIFYYREDLDKWLNEKGRFISSAQARLVTQLIQGDQQ